MAAQAGVVGLGLIGGSLGLDLQSRGWRVQGLVHRQATAERALARGLVSAVSTDPACLRGCDLVILALPIPLLLNPAPELLEALPRDAVITDVGSVKRPVLEAWKGRHPRFVASHPMAGTAAAGVEAGLADLFQGRPWIATNTRRSCALAVVEAGRDLGSHWLTSVPLGDQAVALISICPCWSARLCFGRWENGIRRSAARDGSGVQWVCRHQSRRRRQPDLSVASSNQAVLRGLAAYRWGLEQRKRLCCRTTVQLRNSAHALRPSFSERFESILDDQPLPPFRHQLTAGVRADSSPRQSFSGCCCSTEPETLQRRASSQPERAEPAWVPPDLRRAGTAGPAGEAPWWPARHAATRPLELERSLHSLLSACLLLSPLIDGFSQATPVGGWGEHTGVPWPLRRGHAHPLLGSPK